MGSNQDLEIDVENHLANLDRLVDSIDAHREDLMLALRDKVKATHRMLHVAKLLSEPARESMLSKVRDSLCDLEEVIASQLGLKTNLPYSAPSSGNFGICT